MGVQQNLFYSRSEGVKVVMLCVVKPMHNIGKVSVNASILYKNQEICNKTNL